MIDENNIKKRIALPQEKAINPFMQMFAMVMLSAVVIAALWYNPNNTHILAIGGYDDVDPYLNFTSPAEDSEVSDEEIELYRTNAEKGDAHYQSKLGTLYYYGTGVTQNYVEALKWYRLSAEQGYVQGQYNLGSFYHSKRGGLQDYTKAMDWYRLAAVQGYAPAQNAVGNMYFHAQGVSRDYDEAMKWYRLAADQGYADAQIDLGTMYASAAGMRQDWFSALRWYNLAAQQGDAYAQYNVGAIFADGMTGVQDYVEAYKWFSLASKQGVEKAKAGMLSMRSMMSPEQLQDAMKRVENFRRVRYDSISLIPLGDVTENNLKMTQSIFSKRCGNAFEINILPSIPISSSDLNASRQQYSGDALINTIASNHSVKNLRTLLIGVTNQDIYWMDRLDFGYVFNLRKDRFAVVSTARMWYGGGSDRQTEEYLIHNRLYKIIAKQIGILYFDLPFSDDSNSILYGNIGGIDDLDNISDDSMLGCTGELLLYKPELKQINRHNDSDDI